MSKSIKQIEREEKKALKRREKLNRQKGASGEKETYTIKMARHDAAARDGNGYAKDGMGGD